MLLRVYFRLICFEQKYRSFQGPPQHSVYLDAAFIHAALAFTSAVCACAATSASTKLRISPGKRSNMVSALLWLSTRY
jgi:hypothetical protein